MYREADTHPVADGGSPRGSETPQADGSTLWEIRTEEKPYAFLNDPSTCEKNRYGQKIDLLDLTGLPENRSMYINENPEVGTNPNRNKQHGFFFTADNCIGCHACEAACAEKNETPAHLAFRSVGYVEGGSFPDYKRMNISMACNHCDDPVCLRGCPTKAYTKHAEYGAVLQDPETCFGCGYCTWVCPYNAPQLDPVEGQVSKCNMCVDRLEVGLKPACVSACLGNALDFGVIENVPENREQAKVSIPGFPTPDITHPNIRFQQTRVLPDEMKRTDIMPLKYHRDESGEYRTVVDQKRGKTRHWNLKRLSSRENPLVLFTLLSQASIGGFAMTFLAAKLGVPGLGAFVNGAVYPVFLAMLLGMVGLGLLMSTLHLGKPLRFYRGFNNLRYSPVCREGLGIAVYMAMLGLHMLLAVAGNATWAGIWGGTSAQVPLWLMEGTAYLGIASSLAGLYYMNRCYRIKARPFWDHWQVATSFFGSMFSLGALTVGLVVITSLALVGAEWRTAIGVFGAIFLVGAGLEGIGLIAHARAMNSAQHEGAASHYIQCTTFGRTYFLRNLLLLAAIVLAAAAAWVVSSFTTTWLGLGLWATASLCLIVSAVIGRALFYVLVVPTTMPGAFFWRNKGFEEHARDIGLANLPQVGVAPLHH